MSCYHPFLGIPDYDNLSDKGRRNYKINGRYDPDFKNLYPGAIAIPCGKCIGCRLDYSRAWADRMMLELDHTGKGLFVTLTYNNDHVPFTEDEYTGEIGFYSLCKRDLQLFFKKLRKKFPDKEIRFYAAGEYGSKTDRPHYHAIIFGLGFEDFPEKDIVFLKKNQLGNPIFSVRQIAEAWSDYDRKRGTYDSFGFVTVADVSWKTCAYVSRYVQKKVFDNKFYLQDIFGAEPEFSLMSRRPGLGAYYLEDHPDTFEYSVLHPSGCEQDINLPKFFLKKLDDGNSVWYDEEKYKSLREQRKKFAEDKVLLKLQQTDLPFIEFLENEENKKLLVTSNLKRDMEFV